MPPWGRSAGGGMVHVPAADLPRAAPSGKATPHREMSMESLLNHVAEILERHPWPALPVAELVRQLRHDTTGVLPSEEALLRLLSREPHRFRVLQASAGIGALSGRVASVQERCEPHGPALLGPEAVGPWIIGTPGGAGAGAPHVLGRVRTSLAHLGRRLDPGSGSAVVRWLGHLAECRRLSAAGLGPDGRRAA